MALQLQKQSGISSLVLLDGSHKFIERFAGQTVKKLAGGVDDIAQIEALIMCEFVSTQALRLDVGKPVCFLFKCTL